MTDRTAFAIEYGQRVLTARRNAELTQTELGEHLDLTRSSIANIEAGRQGVSAELVVRMATVLRVPAGWLLTGDVFAAPTQPVITRKALTDAVARLRYLAETLEAAAIS